MKNSLVLLSSAVAFAATANAQCFSPTGTSVAAQLVATSTSYSVDDEGETPDIAFNGFTFPMRGVNWTHFTISSNGEIYLTDGTGSIGPATFGISDLAELRGVAGDSPRLAAYGGDNQGIAGLVGWDILVDDTVSGEVKISWTGMRNFASTLDDFGMSIKLHAAGAIEFSYAATGWNTSLFSGDFCCLSAGDGVGTAAEPSSDLNAGGDTGALELLYQNDWAPLQMLDLEDQTISFLPNGTGGYTYLVTCGTPPNPPATNTAFGMGCYDSSQFASVYQEFATSAAAEGTLENMAFQYLPTGTGGQLLLPATGTLRPITTATALIHTDDSFATVTPTVPFNFLGTTPVATLEVCSNGFVALGGQPGTFDCQRASSLLNVAFPCYVAYGEDLNPTAAGSGLFYYEEANGVVYITADNVQHYFTVDYQTHQYQFDLASGVVTIVYGDVGNLDTDDVLVGFTPGFSVVDMGGIDLAVDLPFQVYATDIVTPALALSASPAPISTSTTGTPLGYQIDNIPEAFAGTGQYISAVVISLVPNMTGLELTFLGMPGCNSYVDLGQVAGTLLDPLQWSNASQSITFNLPPGLPAGLKIYAQAAAIESGVNAQGAVSSNAIKSLVSDN